MGDGPHESVGSQVFPRTAARDGSSGELRVGGVAVSELVRAYGTPLYVVDEAEARANARAFRRAFAREAARVGTSARIYYASKAFLCVAVARWMHEEGLSIDVASGGELAVALAAGVPPHRIGLHGNNKSEREIAFALEAGVGTIILDSELEIERVAAAASAARRRQRVRLRINSGVHASTHGYLATAHEDQKFGLPLDEAPRLVETILSHPSLDFVGLHCHIGSQIVTVEGFRESARRVLGLYGRLGRLAGRAVPELNLGGGFGIAYRSQEAHLPPSVDELAGEIVDVVAETARELGLALPVLVFEPGRAVIGRAGVTLYTVGTVKRVSLEGSDAGTRSEDAGHQERIYVSVDGGMSDNLRTALYGAQYEARLAGRSSRAPLALARVVGKHCEAGDVVVDRDLLPDDVAPGDTLAVPVTGAYCWSLANNYNYVPRPAVVAVAGGAARLIVRGETEHDLLARSVPESR